MLSHTDLELMDILPSNGSQKEETVKKKKNHTMEKDQLKHWSTLSMNMQVKKKKKITWKWKLITLFFFYLGTKRTTSGAFKEDYGRLAFFDDLVNSLVGGDSSALATAENKAKELSGQDRSFANIYVLFMKVYQKRGSSFPSAERERMARLIDAGSISKEKRDEFMLKTNILSAFSN